MVDAVGNSPGNTDEAELTARLCRIGLVSWRWNIKGVIMNIVTAKPFWKTETGVIAQNVRAELGDIYPNLVVPSRSGFLTVDYGTLANIAYENLEYLDEEYRGLLGSAPSPRPVNPLVLKDLMAKYYTADPQLAAVRGLALVQTYDREIKLLIGNGGRVGDN